MKKSVRHMLLLMLVMSIGSVCHIEASPVPEGLFPKSTGLSGKVVGSQVNIRNYPDRAAKVINQVHFESVKVIGKNNEWYKVAYGGEEGWVYGDYVDVPDASLIPYAKVKGEELVAYGLQFIGTPYVWGGNDLNRGVDCSGFTQEVYEAFDIPISRVSYMQATDGMNISKENLRTGDLVFFDTEGTNNGSISHVGIYMGNDQFVHSDSTRGVSVSKLTSPYYTRNYVKGVRILG
ncbi:MAG: NlpC/P60 family protein [Cellulosilyticaceae bacterium]